MHDHIKKAYNLNYQSILCIIVHIIQIMGKSGIMWD